MTFEELKRLANELNPYGKHLGIKITEISDNCVIGLLAVTENLLNPNGTLHGGAYYSLADTAAGVLSRTSGRKNVTLEGKLNFIKSVGEGVTIKAIAKKIHQGKTTGVYLVDIEDENCQILATGIYTMYYIE
jgi:uncharacterized domain 1